MPIDFTGSGNWDRVYFATFQGNPQNRKISAPLIEPVEIPLLFEKHIFAVNAICMEAKPRWRTAGYLKQVYSGINLEDSPITWSGNSPVAGVDAVSKRIGLNSLELVIFPKLANNFYLWFDPVFWLPKLTLGIWEFTGVVTPERIEELVETLKVDVLRVEAKVDQLRN